MRSTQPHMRTRLSKKEEESTPFGSCHEEGGRRGLVAFCCCCSPSPDVGDAIIVYVVVASAAFVVLSNLCQACFEWRGLVGWLVGSKGGKNTTRKLHPHSRSEGPFCGRVFCPNLFLSIGLWDAESRTKEEARRKCVRAFKNVISLAFV